MKPRIIPETGDIIRINCNKLPYLMRERIIIGNNTNEDTIKLLFATGDSLKSRDKDWIYKYSDKISEIVTIKVIGTMRMIR